MVVWRDDVRTFVALGKPLCCHALVLFDSAIGYKIIIFMRLAGPRISQPTGRQRGNMRDVRFAEVTELIAIHFQYTDSNFMSMRCRLGPDLRKKLRRNKELS